MPTKINKYTDAIVSWKYNDIFYGLAAVSSTDNAERLLIVIKSQNYSNYIPCKNEFAKSIIIDHVGSTNYDFLKTLRTIKNVLKNYEIENIYLSNAILIINQIICKVCSVKNVYLLEDGLMNYYNFESNKEFSKVLMQKIFGVSDNKIYDIVKKTYLLQPEKAVYYKGEIKKINLNNINISSEIINQLNNKSILIGMPLYKKGKINVSEYNQLINKLISDYNIDLYIPHLFASDIEQVDCPVLDLSRIGCTLEVMATKIDFKIFSFGSSVSYSTKLINPNVCSILFRTRYVDYAKLGIIVSTVDEIINI